MANSGRSVENLIAQAQRQLDEGEFKAALDAATAVEESACQQGKTHERGDALRIMINAHRGQAEALKQKPHEADRLAEKELGAFREFGEKREIGVVLLAMTECSSDRRGTSRRDRALAWGLEALSLFREVGDEVYQVWCLCEVAFIRFKMMQPDEVVPLASEALTIARRIGFRRGEANALHGFAYAKILEKASDEATDYARQALTIYRELGLDRLSAATSRTIAHWHFDEDRPQKAFPAAQEAMQFFMEKNGVSQQGSTLFVLVMSLIGKQQVEEGLQVAQDALSRSRKSGDKLGQASAFEILFHAYATVGREEDALQAAEDGIDVLHDLKEKSREHAMMLEASKIHMTRLDHDEAIKLCRRAKLLAQEECDEVMEGKALQRLSLNLLNAGQLQKSLQGLNEALDIFERKKDTKEIASTLFLVICAYQTAGEFDNALSISKDVMQQFQVIGDAKREAYTCQLVGEMHAIRKDYTAALEALKPAPGLWLSVGDKRQAAAMMLTIATVHQQNQDLQEAARMARESRRTCRAVGDTTGEVSAHTFLVRVYLNMYDADTTNEDVLKKAQQAAAEAVSLANGSKRKTLRGSAMYWRSQVLMTSGKVEEALRAASEAERLFHENGEKEGEVLTLIMIADIYNACAMKETALQNAERALSIAQETGDMSGIQQAEETIDRIKDIKRKVDQVEEVISQEIVAVPEEVVESVVVVEAPKLDGTMVTEKLLGIAREILVSGEDLELDAPFMGAGMDSLAGIQMSSDVGKAFSINLSPTAIFEYPDIRAMADHILEETSGS